MSAREDPMDRALDPSQWAGMAAGWLTIAWAVQDLTEHYRDGHWFGLPLTVLASCGLAMLLRNDRRGAWPILAAAALAGVAEHLMRTPVVQSNVLAEIVQASDLLAKGHDPYRVPAADLVDGLYLYPPGPLLFYGPLGRLGIEVLNVERAASVAIVLILAGLGRRIGPAWAALFAAMYGTYLFGSFRALDGDNNSTLALLFILSILLLERGEVPDRTGRVAFWAAVPILALGILLKQLAWPVYAFIALYLVGSKRGRWHVASTVAIVVVTIVPFAIDYPGMIPRLFAVVGNKPTVYGLNLLGALQMFNAPLAARLIPATLLVQLAAAAITTAALTRTGSHDVVDAVTRSLAVMLVLMLLSSWTSPAYYMFMGSIIAVVFAMGRDRSPTAVRGIGWSNTIQRWTRIRASA